MNNRRILDELIQKFEVAESSKSKEIRISLSDIHKYHLALTKLLLENSEALQKNNKPVRTNSKIIADGGGFKS